MKRRLKKMFLVLVVSLVLSEILLRLFSFKPGYWGKFEGFYPVDSLVMAKNFVTDEYGIYKFGPWVTDSLKREKHFDWRTTMLVSDEAKNALTIADNITYIHATFRRLAHQGKEDYTWTTKLLYRIIYKGEEDWDTEFTRSYSNISQNTPPNELDKAILNYVSSPFNREGFRSIEFKVHDTTNVRILLIGDSFAYGMSCGPYFNSYADILLARGYEVYNTGIPGVDPAQYAALAEKYVPLLKPDMVILNYCDREDLMRFPRITEKNKPHEHASNAGFFDSYPLGKYLPPHEAYDYYLSLTQIPDTDSKPFNRFCSKFVITSFAWGAMMKRGFFEHSQLNEYYNFQGKVDDEMALAFTQPYIMKIDSICKANHVKLYNILVPEKSSGYNEETQYININKPMAERLFLSNYHHPEDVFLHEDFHPNEDHFNNVGAMKFADFIENVIKDPE